MTPIEVLDTSISKLVNIPVQIGLMGTIGKPIEEVVGYLTLLRKAFAESEQQRHEADEVLQAAADEADNSDHASDFEIVEGSSLEPHEERDL